MDRNVSFSVKPEDLEGQENIRKLKEHAKSKGISFSFFMLRAVKLVNKELKLK